MLRQQDATCPDVSDDGTSIIIIKVLLQLLCRIIGSLCRALTERLATNFLQLMYIYKYIYILKKKLN